MDYQKITASLIGNTTHDAEIKQARESGKTYADFRVAVRGRDGETNFFPVRCFGKIADGAIGIKKGTKLFVEGELEVSSFVGDDGDKRMTYRVVATTYRILSGRTSERNNGRDGE